MEQNKEIPSPIKIDRCNDCGYPVYEEKGTTTDPSVKVKKCSKCGARYLFGPADKLK